MSTTPQASGAGIDELAKKTDTLLRSAERSMFGGKKEQCEAELGQAQELIEAMEAADATSSKISQLKQRLDKQQKALERRAGASPSPAAPSPDKGAAAPAAGSGAKLPAGVTKRLGQISTELDRAEAALADMGLEAKRRISKCTAAVETIAGLQQEIGSNYGAQVPSSHPDLQAVAARIASVQGQLAALERVAQEGAARQTQDRDALEERCAEWVQKLEPYRTGAQRQELVLQHAVDADGIRSQRAELDRARTLLEELRAQDWSAGRTPALEQGESNLLGRLEQADRVHRESLERLVAEPSRLVEAQLSAFAKDQGWAADGKKQPIWVSARDRLAIEESLALLTPEVRGLMGTGTPSLGELDSKVEQLWKENERRLGALAGRVTPDPDRYQGEDAPALREKAADIVRTAEAGAKVLRVTLPAADWRVEDVVEHTDTSKTALRHRVTHWQFAQVAALGKTGLHLYRVHLAKDQRTGGGFGALYGNAEDHPLPMVKANVGA